MARVTGGEEGRRPWAAASTWFPGEMARTRRLIKESLPLVGLVIEVADARSPRASRYPRLTSLVPNRPILTVLSKSDLAEPAATRAWIAHLKETRGSTAGAGEFSAASFCALRRGEARDLAKLAVDLGRTRTRDGPVRAMVVGLPNVGKSTLINGLVGRASARTGDRPGITQGKQLLRAPGGLELLDLPGILVPGTIPPRVALLLAMVGILPGPAFEATEVARHILSVLATRGRLTSDLARDAGGGADGGDLLGRFALLRGHLVAGGAPDFDRAAIAVIGAFREGRFGRVTLELPGSGDPAAGGGS